MKKYPILIASAVLLSAGNPFAGEIVGYKAQVQPGGNPPAGAAGDPATGQPAQLKPGSPNVIRIGEGGEGITVTINGEKVKAAQGEPKASAARTIQFAEMHRQIEKGPWLGLAMEPASEALRAQLSLGKEEGLLITHVVQSSPANRAGLARNDILLRLDDQILVEPSQLRKLISMKKPGDHVKLTYMRKAERKETNATLIEHVIETAGNPSFEWSGAPGQYRKAEGKEHEVTLRLDQLLQKMKERSPGAAPQENPYVPRLNPAQGAPPPQNPQPPRPKAAPGAALPQNPQPLQLNVVPGTSAPAPRPNPAPPQDR